MVILNRVVLQIYYSRFTGRLHIKTNLLITKVIGSMTAATHKGAHCSLTPKRAIKLSSSKAEAKYCSAYTRGYENNPRQESATAKTNLALNQ